MKLRQKIFILIFGVCCFSGGVFWQKHQLLQSGIYKLQAPLVLEAEPGQKGVLPKGSYMYAYTSGSTVQTYIVFISAQDLKLLKPVRFSSYMAMAPISAYPK